MQDTLDLGYGEQRRNQGDTRKAGRGFYPKDSGEPRQSVKKERRVSTWSDLVFKVHSQSFRGGARPRAGREGLDETGVSR